MSQRVGKSDFETGDLFADAENGANPFEDEADAPNPFESVDNVPNPFEDTGNTPNPFESNDGDINPFSVTTGRKATPKHVEEKTWLGRVLSGLDYARNIAASGIVGSKEGKGFEWAQDAARNQRTTTGTDVRDAIFGKIRFGQDDHKFQAGDLADFGLDLATDLATDPLTYLTGGLNRVAKGAAMGAKSVAEVAPAVKAAIGVPGRAALGGVYGLGMAPEDASIPEQLAYGAGGAAIVGAGSKYAPALKASGKAASNAFLNATVGAKFPQFAENMEIASNAFNKRVAKAREIMESREAAMTVDGVPLNAAERVELQRNVLEPLKTETIKKRDGWLFAIRQTPQYTSVRKKMMATGKTLEEAQESIEHSPWFVDLLQKKTKAINEEVATELAPKIVAGRNERIQKALQQWTEYTDEFMKDYNVNALKTDAAWKPVTKVDGKKQFSKAEVGIKYHIPDLVEKQDIDQFAIVQKGMTNAAHKLAKSTERSAAVKEIAENIMKREGVSEIDAYNKAYDKVFTVYANKESYRFLDDVEKKAAAMVAEHAATKSSFWKGFDSLTGWIKQLQLQNSMNWIRTNYFDNIGKSFNENGIMGAVDAATLGYFHKDVARDVWKLSRDPGARDLVNEGLVREAQKLGVLETPTFQALMDDDVIKYVKTPKQIAEALKDAPPLSSVAEKLGKDGYHEAAKVVGVVGQGMQKGLDALAAYKNFLGNTIGRVGSAQEGISRVLMYKRTKDLLSKTLKDASEEEIQRLAAKATKDAFFDYSTVTALEKQVLKRVVPFAVFYGRNLPYWLNVMTDPMKVGRVAALEHVRKNIGSTPTERDQSAMSKYIAESAPRYLGRDNRGNKMFAVFPGMSQYDAIKMANPAEWRNQLADKGHPLGKLAFEALSKGDYDTFTGDKLLPSKSSSGKKFLFSQGYHYWPMVDIDKHGNPYTRSDALVWADRVLSTLLPHGIVDQVAGSAGKMLTRKSSVGQEMMNRFGPANVVEVSPQMERMQRLDERLKEKRERKNEAWEHRK